ncbi:MAG TPA: FtsX-like permease family protein [Caulobacteraceae bacterium]|jgi:putative ABC transport system permease protein|nr:FtsX-like permease family protein [Caulobacteraceae bacterium]
MSLALATLIYEWRRYLAAIIALGCAGLLVLAFIGLFAGIVKAATANIERARADIMVLPPKTESLVNANNTLPTRIKPLIYMNPEVVEVASLDGAGGQWVNAPEPGKKQVTQFVGVNVVDTQPGAVTLPVDYPETVRMALTEPGAIVVDKSALARLGIKVGGKGTINGHTVRLRALLENYQNINNIDIVMSRETFERLNLRDRGNAMGGPLMVRIKDPERADIVRDQLNAASHKTYRAWTREELNRANEGAIMKEQIIGVIVVFIALIGTAIGIAITAMTLRGAILANIKEFATLRALGVSMGSLRAIVLELSGWVGAVGLIATAILTAGVTALAGAAGLPMVYRPPVVIAVTVMLLVIAALSGIFSLGMLKKSQPADLLR